MNSKEADLAILKLLKTPTEKLIISNKDYELILNKQQIKLIEKILRPYQEIIYKFNTQTVYINNIEQTKNNALANLTQKIELIITETEKNKSKIFKEVI